MTKLYCGHLTTLGHGDIEICGVMSQTGVYQCQSCKSKQAADRIEHLERVLLLAKMALEYHTQQTRPIHGTAQTIAAIDEALKS